MRVLTSARANSVCIIALASALLGVGQAAAQQPSQDQIAAIKSSCRSDYMSYCSSVSRGGSQALQCLKGNLAKLSSACQQAVKAATATAAASATTQAAPPATSPSAWLHRSLHPVAGCCVVWADERHTGAAAKAKSPAKTAKKTAATTAKAASQPSPAAGSTGTAPSGASKPAAAVAAVPAAPAPTAAAVPPASSVLAYIFFLPDDFLAFCKSVAATTLFSSNSLFWQETGYFEGPET